MNKPTAAARAVAMDAQAPFDLPEAHANVWVALAAAQAEFSAPRKDSVNPAFKSKYADLSSVVAAVAPGLSRHGISFSHLPQTVDFGDGPRMCWSTVLVHGASDTRIECPVPVIVNKNDMQGFKSAVTYAKRIGLESVTGVAPDDDDGNDAAKAPEPQRATQMSAEEFRLLRTRIDAQDDAEKVEQHFLAANRIASLHNLTKPQWEAAMRALDKREKAKETA